MPLQLNNTVGIIDSDYFYSDNEGHIFIKITNDSNEEKTVQVGGSRIYRGLHLEYTALRRTMTQKQCETAALAALRNAEKAEIICRKLLHIIFFVLKC